MNNADATMALTTTNRAIIGALFNTLGESLPCIHNARYSALISAARSRAHTMPFAAFFISTVFDDGYIQTGSF